MRLFLLTCVAALTTMPGFTRSRPVELFADPALTSRELGIIENAAAAWNSAAPGLFSIRSGYSAWGSISKDVAERSGGTILLANYGYGRWRVISSNITLNAKLHGLSLYNTALHEFGHAIGLDHGPGVMGGMLSVSPSGEILPPSGRLSIAPAEAIELAAWVAGW